MSEKIDENWTDIIYDMRENAKGLRWYNDIGGIKSNHIFNWAARLERVITLMLQDDMDDLNEVCKVMSKVVKAIDEGKLVASENSNPDEMKYFVDGLKSEMKEQLNRLHLPLEERK